MPTDIPLRCGCGQVRGVATAVSPASGNRMVCYCDDCQAFAHHLDRADVLDAHGGTDVFQVAPAQVRITEGHAQLRCLRLSEKGAFRWYAGCCRTPLANTVPWIPFVGIIHAFMDHPAGGRSRDEALGQPIALVNGRFAVGGTPPHAHPKAPLGVIARVLRVMLGWIVRRQTRPSPFFDARTKQPVVTPHVLTPDERRAAYERVRRSGATVAAR